MITELFGSVLRLGRTYTPPIGTAGGVAELKPVDLNGHPQWLLIRGKDVTKPLLLLLHGGPGISDMWLAHRTTRELEEHFVCVFWDQRGTGKSLRPRPDPSTMTVEQLVKDAITLIELLLARFGQKKLLLLGESWGSVMAMRVAAARPDLVYAVIGMGQQVDTKRGETISYRFVLERAHADRNRKAIRALEKLGSSDTFWKGGKFVERMWLLRLGGVMHSVDLPTMVKILLEAPEYSIADCIRYARNSAARFSIPLMADGLLSVNLVQEIKRLSVPIVLFEGRHDHTCPPEIAEEFYNSLQAPYKQWVWFENSGHTPDLEEPEKFEREVLAVGQRFCAATPTAAA